MVDPNEPDALAQAFVGLADVPRAVRALTTKLERLGAQMDAIEARLPPLLVSINEAAAALGVSVSTVKRLIQARELPVTRIGRRVRIDIGSARAFTADQIAEMAAKARAR